MDGRRLEESARLLLNILDRGVVHVFESSQFGQEGFESGRICACLHKVSEGIVCLEGREREREGEGGRMKVVEREKGMKRNEQ